MNPVSIPEKSYIGDRAQNHIDFLTDRIKALEAENARLKKELEEAETLPQIETLFKSGKDLLETPLHVKYPACFQELS